MNPYYLSTEDTAYGFLTRGCIRVCDTIQNIVQDKSKVCLMDNNLFAYEDVNSSLEWLADHRIVSDLNQGLDFRLATDENLALLKRIRHSKPYIFALDDVSYIPMWEERLSLFKTYFPAKNSIQLYIYYHPKMALDGLVQREEFCREHGFLPYIMRDSACWTAPDTQCKFVKDFTSWCNQPYMWKYHTFDDFLHLRYPNNEARRQDDLAIYENILYSNTLYD